MAFHRLALPPRFQVVRRIGEGGMGVVYEALDVERNVLVALKTLRYHDPDALARFKHEFRALQDIHHPNLVALGERIVADVDDVFFHDGGSSRGGRSPNVGARQGQPRRCVELPHGDRSPLADRDVAHRSRHLRRRGARRVGRADDERRLGRRELRRDARAERVPTDRPRAVGAARRGEGPPRRQAVERPRHRRRARRAPRLRPRVGDFVAP